MEPPGIHHVAVKVADLARAEAFYVGVLGLPVLRRWLAPDTRDGQQARSLWLDLGAGAFLAIERSDGPGPSKSEAEPGIHLLALHIRRSERESWIAKLAGAGFPIYQHTDYTIYVQDPEGNRIGLSHWGE
jgi:catechol 2,3-dioxygenase-like lactoylglutathione lyase family enzyme